MYSYLFIFIIALLLSLAMTPVVRHLAGKLGWVDRPDGSRKVHLAPVPVVGGVGIYCAVVLSLVPVHFLDTAVAEYVRSNLRNILSVLALSGLMMLVGFWDDLKNLSPWKKLSAQTAIAVACWFAGFRILGVWGEQYVGLLGWMSFVLTVLWIVLITNAFNMIDGMDGLAAGAALFSTLAMLVVSMSGHQTHSVIFLAGLAGAILGFLRYNFNPATIFLGDSGSLLLGFMLSLAAIIGSQKSTAAFSIAVPVVALGLPILDTVLTIARRFVRGRPLFAADGRHIHHMLIQKGLPTRRAAIILYGICGMFGLFSLFFINPSGKTNGVILAVLGFCVLFGIQKLRYSELSVLGGHLSRGLQNQRRLLAAGVAVRRITERIGKAENLDEFVSIVGGGMGELGFSMFEILIPDRELSEMIGRRENWEALPLAAGGTVLRWTSSCRNCSRIRKAYIGGSHAGVRATKKMTLHLCEKCEDFKNPLLQKSALLASASQLFRNDESHMDLPLTGNNGCGTRKLEFYYPSGVSYPVGAIAVLSENVGGEFEKALERILNSVASRRVDMPDAEADSAAVQTA